jgi:hypothetical protein
MTQEQNYWMALNLPGWVEYATIQRIDEGRFTLAVKSRAAATTRFDVYKTLGRAKRAYSESYGSTKNRVSWKEVS